VAEGKARLRLLDTGQHANIHGNTRTEWKPDEGMSKPATLSAVVPTLNEAEALPETLRRLRSIPEVREILISDGGSSDDTEKITAEFACAFISAPRGRGRQMRHAAAMAKGDVVLLVHADTWLPEDAGKAALACFSSSKVVGGGFWKEFRGGSLIMRGQRPKAWIRLVLGKRIMGDQAMFIRRDVLESIGGVPDVPLMEDFELSRSVRKFGHLVLADATVTTSARRFQKRGVLRTYALMWSIVLRYYLGATPEELARRYGQ
jgi:rSAM/selenodomain-associated transferase 2